MLNWLRDRNIQEIRKHFHDQKKKRKWRTSIQEQAAETAEFAQHTQTHRHSHSTKYMKPHKSFRNNSTHTHAHTQQLTGTQHTVHQIIKDLLSQQPWEHTKLCIANNTCCHTARSLWGPVGKYRVQWCKVWDISLWFPMGVREADLLILHQ